MKINTVGEAKNYLLSVMEFADNEQSKGNKSLTKEEAWNLFIGALTWRNDDEELNEILKNNILREFPEYLTTIN